MINALFSGIKQFRNPADNVEVVVLGHQKGGTTAIAALLGKISGLGVSIDPLFQVDQGKAKQVKKLIRNPKKIEWLCVRHPRLFVQPIVKDPDLIFIYQAVRECYRNAHILFVVRDPRDTIRSICNRLNLAGSDLNRCPKSSDMKGGNHHWELVLSGRLPKHELYKQQSSLIYNLAHRWNLAAEIFLEFADEMTFLRYEDFLKDKEKSIAKVAHNFEIECTQSIADYVDVQYQPKGNSNTDWSGFFGPKNLSLIETICARPMHEFGYDSLTDNKQ